MPCGGDAGVPMYLSYYGFDDLPFRITPDTKYLFFTPQYEAALDSLKYAITQRMGFAVLTGEVGTGKTTLSRHLLAQLGPDVETALLINPFLSVPELLQAINKDFGIALRALSPERQMQALNKYLLALHTEGRTALVVIDESQNLSIEALEMVRMLSNLETERAKLIQILLVGQPELDSKLLRHELRQLRQRVSVHMRLSPLTMPEMVRYITHRMLLAGGRGQVNFEPAAYRALYRLTKGLPRLVNLLCDRALTAAYAVGAPSVTKRHVKQAYADLRLGQLYSNGWGFWRKLGKLTTHVGW